MDEVIVFNGRDEITAYYSNTWKTKPADYHHFTWIPYDPTLGPPEE